MRSFHHGKLPDYSKQTTLNVGVIQGGTASNVVLEEAVIQRDVRVMQAGEWERLESEMEKLKPVLDGTAVEITGGASDANFVAPLDIPVLDGLGAVGEGYHSEREYVIADSLEARAKLIAALLREW